MRVSKAVVLLFCASGSTTAASAFVPSFGICPTARRHGRGITLLQQSSSKGRFRSENRPITSSPSPDSLSPIRSIRADDPLAKRRKPIQPDALAPPKNYGDVDFGPSLFEQMNQSSPISKTKRTAPGVQEITGPSEPVQEQVLSEPDIEEEEEASSEEPASEPAADSDSTPSQDDSLDASAVMDDASDVVKEEELESESADESSDTPPPPTDVADAPTVKTSIKVKTGERKQDTTFSAGSDKPRTREEQDADSKPVATSGMSGIAGFRKPPSDAASPISAIPSLLDEINQGMATRRTRHAVSIDSVPIVASATSKPTFRNSRGTRAASAGEMPSMFERIDNGRASIKRRSLGSTAATKPVSSTTETAATTLSGTPVVGGGMSYIADRGTAPRRLEPAGTQIPSLFDQIDQQMASKKKTVEPAEPLGWGGMREGKPVELEPPSDVLTKEVDVPEISELPVELEESEADVDDESLDADDATKASESDTDTADTTMVIEQETSASVVEISEVESKSVAEETQSDVKESKPAVTASEVKASVSTKEEETTKPVADKASIDQDAASTRKTRSFRTLTPLEKKYTSISTPTKEPKTDKPAKEEEDPISPKLRILGSKYMARLEKAAEGNSKLLRDELDKLRVVDEDDVVASSESEETTPLKKAFEKLMKGKK